MKKFLFLVAFISVFSAFGTQEATAQEPFLGEIKWVGYGFCPRGWSEANGQTLDIASHTALFSLFGTTYGGDGRTTFKLPELRGRSLVHVGTGPGLSAKRWGERGGTETETLTTNQIPSHTHTASGVAEGASASDPSGAYIAKSGTYRAGGTSAQLNSGTIGNAGGGQSHNNLSPFLATRACVAMVGVYPSRS